MKKLSGNKRMAVILLLLGTAVLAAMAVRFIRHRLAYAVTDAVFIRTDSLTTAGFDEVSGRIFTMTKSEGDPVQAGEVLATLDPRSYELEVERLAAELDAARRELDSRRLTLERLAAEVPLKVEIAADQVQQLQKEKAAQEARAAAVQARIEQLQRDRVRYAALSEAQAVARRQTEEVTAELAAESAEKRAVEKQAAALQAALESAERNVQLARIGTLLIEETRSGFQAAEENIKALTARLQQSRNTLAKCVLHSPLTGRVAKRYVSPGDVIESPQAVYALVDPEDVYAVALLEENKLQGVRPGAPVRITIDAYPDGEYRGVVKDVLPTSAATFALAPRDISAGEFTKVTQRIPVRITIDAGDLSRLRVGMGGEVEIERQAES